MAPFWIPSSSPRVSPTRRPRSVRSRLQQEVGATTPMSSAAAGSGAAAAAAAPQSSGANGAGGASSSGRRRSGDARRPGHGRHKRRSGSGSGSGSGSRHRHGQRRRQPREAVDRHRSGVLQRLKQQGNRKKRRSTTNFVCPLNYRNEYAPSTAPRSGAVNGCVVLASGSPTRRACRVS